jgi:general stress protein 26
MAGPPPSRPFTPDEVPALAQETMRKAKFPMVATIDGDQPRVRPVSTVRVDGFTVYFANLKRYGKTAEIKANPKTELCYMDEDHDQVRITGVVEEVTDRALLDDIWASNPLLRRYLGSPDNPDMVIYRVRPTRVRFMREWALDYHEVPLPDSRA